MQLRCTYCQTMFAISREDMLAALEHMEENKQVYYDAHCPKCRRANRVERARMERFFPDWKNAIKSMAKESVQTEPAAEKPANKAVATPKTAAKPKKKHAPKTKTATVPAKKPVAKTTLPKGKPAGTKKK